MSNFRPGRARLAHKVWRFSLDRPRSTLAVAIVLLVALAFEARTLAVDPSVDWLAADHPAARSEAARRAEFGPDFRVLAGFYQSAARGGVFQPTSLAALEDLHQRFEREPGVARIASVVNSPTLVASPEAPEGTPLWPGSVTGAAEILGQRLAASPVESALFLSQAGTLTPLYIEIEPGIRESDLVGRLQRIAREVEERHLGAGEALVVGPAVVESGLLGHVLSELKRLAPFALALSLLILILALRKASFVLVVVLHALAVLVALLGGMAVVGIRVNLVTLVAPVVVPIVGISTLFHFLIRLRNDASDRVADAARESILTEAFSRVERPLLESSVMAALGFLGFLLSGVPSVRQIGLILSAGAILSLLVTLTFDAALLRLLPWRSGVAGEVRVVRLGPIGRWLLARMRSPRAVRRSAGLSLVATLLLSAAGLCSLTYLRSDDSWVQNLDRGSKAARDVFRFESEFLGTNILSLVVASDPADAEARSNSLRLINALPVALYGVPGVHGTITVALLARSLDPAQGPIWQEWNVPPPEALARAYAEWERIGVAVPRAAMLADRDQTRFQVLVFISNRHLWEIERTLAVVKEVAEGLSGAGVTIELGGNLFTNTRLLRIAIPDMGWSLLARLLLSTGLALLIGRGITQGAVLVAPMILTALVTYLVIAILGIPYGIAASMIPGLVIGTAIDASVQLRSCLARNRNASRGRWIADMTVAVKGVLSHGALWTVGFAVLAVSRVPPNRWLGVLCGFVACASTIAALGLLPVAALVAGGRRSGGEA